MTDNRNIVFNYVEVSTKQRRAANWVRTNRINPTVLNTSYTTTRTRHTDVLAADKHYRNFCEAALNFQWYQNGSGTIGLATCDYRVPNGRCDQAVARFSRTFNQDFGRRAVRSNTCHEFGHNIGLKHRRYGCIGVGNLGATRYSDHDRAHFRRYFG